MHTTRLLHVDDDADFTALTSEFLEREDDRIEVVTEQDAAAGLERLENEEIDGIVSDYQMPGMDGLEFLVAVRERNPDIPFILLTGKGSETVASEAITKGATDYLQKQPGTELYELLANRVANAVEQYRSARRADNLERIRRVVRDANQALVRAESREEVERRICEIVTDAEPYLLAWIGEHDSATDTVEPRTAAGVEEGYLESIDITTDDERTSQGPTGRAITNDELAIQQNIPEDADYQPWREEALERGYRSSAAVPIRYEDTLYGALNVYADHARAFDEKERELLTELAENIGHAIYRIETHTSEDRYRRIIENLPVGIYRATPGEEGSIIDANSALAEIFDAESAETLIGRPVTDFYKDPARRLELSERLEREGEIHDVEIRQETLPGEPIWISVTAIRIEENGEVYFDGIIHDITERKEREHQLREERDRRQALFENPSDPIIEIEFDEETPIIHETNERFADVFGYDPESVIGEPVPSVLVPEEEAVQERHDEIAKRVLDGELVETEVRRQTRDGPREFLLRVYPIELVDGYRGSYAIYTDLTERIERERDLRLFRKAVVASGHSVYITDADGTIEYVNPAFEETTGYSEAEALGRNPRILKSGAHDEAFYTDLWETITSGDVWRSEIINTTKGDERYVADQTIAPVEDETGEITHFVAVNADITQHKERESDLQRYEAIVENTNDGVYVFDSDSHIEFVNGRVLEASGHSRDQLVGEPVSVLAEFGTLTETEVQAVEDAIDAVVRGQSAEKRVELQPDVPHDIRTLEIRLTRGQSGGGDVHVIGFSRDITEFSESQEALERKNERLEEFASVVSHDLRNPLNVADLRLELAHEECESDHLDAVGRALERMNALIDDLLTMAREEEDVEEYEPVELARLAESCWRNVATAEATLTTEIERLINADRSRLQRLLENLMRNAVEHGGENVTVTVRGLEDGFYVEDDGPGIPEDERDDVFEMGYSTSEGGIGFGLSIVEQVAQAHGWDVRVTDGSDGGARFEITDVTFSGE